MSSRIVYNRHLHIVKFEGPGGFTQQSMSERAAEAVARALGLPFEIKGNE